MTNLKLHWGLLIEIPKDFFFSAQVMKTRFFWVDSPKILRFRRWSSSSGNLTEVWKITMFNGNIHYFYGDFPQLCQSLPEGIQTTNFNVFFGIYHVMRSAQNQVVDEHVGYTWLIYLNKCQLDCSCNRGEVQQVLFLFGSECVFGRMFVQTECLEMQRVLCFF